MDATTMPVPAGGNVSAYLELIAAGAVPARIFPLLDEAVIGREPQDSLAAERFLCIPERTVSRRHARIQRQGDTFFVEDLHSSNGTFIGGERIAPGAWYPLKEGDELGVASTRLTFHSLLAPAADALPALITHTEDATRLAWRTAQAGSDGALTMRKLHAMAQVGIALGAVKDSATLTEKIMNFIFELFPLAERAFILLRQGEGGQPVPVAARWRDGRSADLQAVKPSRTIVEEAMQRQHAVLSVDTLADRRFGSQESIVAQAIRSVMCVPLVLEGEALGLIQVDSSSDPHAFAAEDLEMLTGVCAEAAVALKNFQLYSDIERLLEGFVRASVQAIEERDPVTAGHSFRVATYAEALARAVDRADGPALRKEAFSADQLREIRYAALLHDFGKVGVREHVLRKEKKLHQAELALLQQRFRHARACLEREAWRGLVERQCREGLSIDEFRAERRRIEAALSEECNRLNRFLDTIHRANEPAISPTEAPPELKDILDYRFREVDDAMVPLVHDYEFAALAVNKGCLTAEERRQIEAHVADSYSFLVLIPWTRDLAGVPAIAHGHHEKLDGSGYPMGLAGDEICVQTRILTICDIYDALTATDRPYKKAMPAELALELLEAECRGGRIDGRLFEVFVASRAWAAA